MMSSHYNQSAIVPDLTQLDCAALQFRVRQLLCAGLGDHSIAAMTGLDVMAVGGDI
jgi:hypothetical protein